MLVCMCTCVLILDIYEYSSKPNYVIEESRDASECYKPGKIISRITKCVISSDFDDSANVIRSYAIGSKIPYSQKGIAILEHSPKITDDVVYGGKWQQPTPWYDNVFWGNQYFVEAIVNDGGLWSNIGTNLR